MDFAGMKRTRNFITLTLVIWMLRSMIGTRKLERFVRNIPMPLNDDLPDIILKFQLMNEWLSIFALMESALLSSPMA